MLHTCKVPNTISTSSQNKFLTGANLTSENFSKRNLKLIRKRVIEAVVEESKNSILDRYEDVIDKS
jgi:hypothetical protein